MEAYAPCHDSFTRYCTALAYGKMEVEDLTQDVLLSAYEHYENIRKKDQLLPYLIRAARYRSINNWRRSKFKPELLSKDHEGLNAHSNSAEKTLDTQLLYQALNQLPEKQRDAIILYEITGFSMKEIAEIHKSTEGAVKTKISRGRQKLRKMMDDKPKSRALWILLAIPDTDYFANHSDISNRALAEYFPNTPSQIDISQVNAWIAGDHLVSSPHWLSTVNITNWVKVGLGIAAFSSLLIWLAPKNSPQEKVKKPIHQVHSGLLKLVTQFKPLERNTAQITTSALPPETDQKKAQLQLGLNK